MCGVSQIEAHACVRPRAHAPQLLARGLGWPVGPSLQEPLLWSEHEGQVAAASPFVASREAPAL